MKLLINLKVQFDLGDESLTDDEIAEFEREMRKEAREEMNKESEFKHPKGHPMVVQASLRGLRVERVS